MNFQHLGIFAATVGSVLWMVAYLLAISHGFTQKSYAIPAVAIIGNVSWEFMFAFIFPQSSVPQALVNAIWFGLDVVIVVTYLKFGRKDFPRNISPRLFYPSFALGVLTAISIYWAAAIQFDDYSGNFSAFLLNVIISILFIDMLLRRKSTEAQSMYIAVCKMFGSVGYGILFATRHPDWIFIIVLAVLTFVFDLIYTVLLHRQFKLDEIHPYRTL